LPLQAELERRLAWSLPLPVTLRKDSAKNAKNIRNTAMNSPSRKGFEVLEGTSSTGRKSSSPCTMLRPTMLFVILLMKRYGKAETKAPTIPPIPSAKCPRPEIPAATMIAKYDCEV